MPKQPKSEIRRDYFQNKYVIITPSRATRPRDVLEQSVYKKDRACVFCPKKIEKKLLIKTFKTHSDKITILKNKFPAVSLNNSKAYGTQEVIIETAKHGPDLAELSIEQIQAVLTVYAERTAKLSKNKKLDYVLVFKNSGSKAGASLHHSHSQIFATKILPPEVLDELTAARIYRAEKKSCPYCNIIKKEAVSARRIYNDSLVSAIAPYASQFHYEAWIMTKRHLDNITRLTEDEFRSFAKALKQILNKLHHLGLSYNFFLHQVISDTDQHFYLKIQPRDSIWAGVELGSGLIINSISPEAAAKLYRS